jgi:hypothetical protein
VRLALTIAAMLLLTGPVAAGTLRGRLEFGRSSPASGGVKANPSLRDAVVYLEVVPDAVERSLTRRGFFRWFARKPKPPLIRQENLRFEPRVLAVAAGTSVVFENRDSVYHNTFSVSAPKRFDLGRYPPGHRDTVTFHNTGAMNLHCDVHPAEVGFLVVVPNHAYSIPDSYGRFTLSKLQPGTYVVRIWHPRRGELRQQIEMPARGDLDVDLRL